MQRLAEVEADVRSAKEDKERVMAQVGAVSGGTRCVCVVGSDAALGCDIPYRPRRIVRS